jgi:hypothetical protein
MDPSGNQMLIAMQHPSATRLAGFRAWLGLGYCVSKAEKGIRIWAPTNITTRTYADSTGESRTCALAEMDRFVTAVNGAPSSV